MGCWAVGMRASDDALDAVYTFEQLEKRERRKRKTSRRSAGELFVVWLGGDGKSPSAVKVLAVGEFLLERGINLEHVRVSLDSALKRELSRRRLDCWRDPLERKAALLRFRDRLDGKPVDQSLIDVDNEGLMSKIGRFMSGVS